MTRQHAILIRRSKQESITALKPLPNTALKTLEEPNHETLKETPSYA